MSKMTKFKDVQYSVDELRLFSLNFKKDIFKFIDTFMHEFTTSAIPEFHREIYDLLPKVNRLALAAPRGFAKSYICSFFYALHCALFGLKRDICIISASEGLAKEWLRKIKTELEMNRSLVGFFGDLKSSKWSETHIVLSNGVSIRARGAGGQIRGFRPDLLILDDIETDETVTSEEQRNKLRDWIFKACLNTLMPNGQFIMIGTIIHPLSLLNEILNSNNDWEKRRYMAYIDGIQEKGYELWPDLWTHERLQSRKREIGSFAFASEYLNQPIASETQPIKEHQIRYFDKLPDVHNMVIAVDPAYSEDERADYKVATLIAYDQTMNRYVDTYIRTHAPTGEFIDSILNLYLSHKDRVLYLGIPSGGTEKEFFNSFMRKASERHIYPPIFELKNVYVDATNHSYRNKTKRIIAALQPLFEAGKYYIRNEQHELKNELLQIGSSRWDDITDTLAYAESMITPTYFFEKEEKPIVDTVQFDFKPDKIGFGYGL